MPRHAARVARRVRCRLPEGVNGVVHHPADVPGNRLVAIDAQYHVFRMYAVGLALGAQVEIGTF